MLIVLVDGNEEGLFVVGEDAEVVDEYHLHARLALGGIVVVLHVK